MTQHQHRAIPEKSHEYAFMGAVKQPQNEAAHGNICRHDECSCGAVRKTNVNQQHVERGPWVIA